MKNDGKRSTKGGEGRPIFTFLFFRLLAFFLVQRNLSHNVFLFFFFLEWTDVNECQSNPCQNGGRCIDGVGNYSCDCKNGFEGKNCENGKCLDHDINKKTRTYACTNTHTHRHTHTYLFFRPWEWQWSTNEAGLLPSLSFFILFALCLVSFAPLGDHHPN